MEITVIGLGYVGLATATLLASKNIVNVFDIDEEKLNIIKSGKSPFFDINLDQNLATNLSNFCFDKNKADAIKNSRIIFICLPSDFNNKIKAIDDSLISKEIEYILSLNRNVKIVVKSTIGVGFCSKIIEKLKDFDLFYMPEFLREGSAFDDVKNPDRIVIGCNPNKPQITSTVVDVIYDVISDKNTPIYKMNYEEAEATKLFANTYLAMRVSFFNELDSYAIENNLDTKTIIEGVCADKRIGQFYNNPSFGFGGYCLPKDTKTLKKNFDKVPDDLISGVIDSNDARIKFMAKKILEYIDFKHNKNINLGIYKLACKTNSNDYRSSPMIQLIKYLKQFGLELVIYEPGITTKTFDNIPVENDQHKFDLLTNYIVANRQDDFTLSLGEKVFSRDIYHK